MISRQLPGDELYDVAVHEVIRPAAVLPDSAARQVLVELAHDDVRSGGRWACSPVLWQRFDRPWAEGDTAGPGDAILLGSVQVGYGTPSRYAITLYRASITGFAAQHGWTVESLCDEALAYGGYCLAECPRADLAPRDPAALPTQPRRLGVAGRP